MNTSYNQELTWVNGQLADLKAGDILLFRPSKKVTFSQKLIMFAQSLVRKKHGHYDTVHAAVCTGRDLLNQPMIAHVTVVPNHKGAYIHEPIQNMLNRDGGDRPFIVYRHKNSVVANEMGRVAAEISSVKAFKYSVFSAASSIVFYPKFSSDQTIGQKEISTKTFCSRFVIQVMKKANGNLAEKGLVAAQATCLPARSTPKSLESFLSQRADYQKWCYVGNNPFQDILQEVQKQLLRMSLKNNAKTFGKYQRAEVALVQVLNAIAKNPAMTEWEKAKCLYTAMLPVFKQKTAFTVKNATSYTSLTSLARTMGIFKNDISKISKQTNCHITLNRNTLKF